MEAEQLLDKIKQLENRVTELERLCRWLQSQNTPDCIGRTILFNVDKS